MKERIRLFYERVFFTPRPFPPGNYQLATTSDDGSPLRLHLRIEKDGMGILIVNAKTILHLNPTATELAYHLVNNESEDTIVKEMVKRYRVDEEVAHQDYINFKERLSSLINTPDLDPETFLDFERVAPHSQDISAPLRLDCALTYQTSNGDASIYAPVDRVQRNLDTEEWKQILEKAWKAGIPHIIFTGGEPTLRPDLPELVQKAQELGQVTGVITDGLRFAEKDYLHQLLQAGLDHMLMVLSPEESESWEALRDVFAEDIFTSVHLTITEKNSHKMDLWLEKLQKMGVKSLSLSADSDESAKLLPAIQQKSAEGGFALIWDLPVPYSVNNPINLELEAASEKVHGAGKTWLYLEPDGDVLPGQGINQVLGNMLSDPWEQIWLNTSK